MRYRIRYVVSHGIRAPASRTLLLMDAEERSLIGELIADGYRRIPQTDEDVEAARRVAIMSIEDEPWSMPRSL